MESLDKINTRTRRNDLPMPIAPDSNRKINDRKTGDTLCSVRAEDVLTKGHATSGAKVQKKVMDMPYTEVDSGNPETLLPTSYTTTTTVTTRALIM